MTVKKSDVIFKNALYAVFTEILFNVLPLIVLTIIFAYQNKASSLFYATEWSLTSAIFFGQTIAKLLTSLLSSKISVHHQRVVALIVSLMVLGLVPSLVVFMLMITSNLPSSGLAVGQIVLFIISIIVYIFLGSVSEWIMAEKKII